MTRPETRPPTWALALELAALVSLLTWLPGFPDPLRATALPALLLLTALALREPSFGARWPAAVLVGGMLLAALSSGTPDWDARSIWLFHGKRIFFDGHLGAQLDGYAGFSQNDYPVLLSAISASIARTLGSWNEIAPKAGAVLLAVPPLLVLGAEIPSTFRKLALANLVVFLVGRSIVSGYVDGLLALHLAAAVIAAAHLADAEPMSGGRGHWGAAFVLLAAAAGLLKNEGLPGVLAVAAGTVLSRPGEVMLRAAARLGPATALALMPVAGWKLACSSAGITSVLAKPGILDRFAGRIADPHAVQAIATALLFRPGLVLPAVVLVATTLLGRGAPRAALRQVVLGGGAYLAVLAAAYLSTPDDLGWHLRTSAERVTLPLALWLGWICVRHLPGPRVYATR